MQKNVVIIAVIVGVLLLIGGGAVFMNMAKGPQNTPAQNTANTAQSSNNAGTSVVGSIKDVLMGGASFQCEFTDEDGNQTKSYIKAGKVRTDTIAVDSQQSGSAIMRDKTMYFWNGKQGMKMTFDQNIAEMSEEAVEEYSNEQQKDVMQDLEKYKEYCKPGSVSDSLFEPPTDVTFTDFSGFMQPTGAGRSNAMPSIDQKQIEELMKQFAPENQ